MNVVDAMMVSVGLDATEFVKGQKQVADETTKTKDVISKSAKESEKAAKDMAEGFGKASAGALELFALLLGGKAFKAFISDAVAANTSIGQFSAGLGSTSEMVSIWNTAVRRMGGSATSAMASIQAVSDSLTDLRTQGKAPPMELFLLSSKSGKDVDFQHGWENLMITAADAASTLAKEKGDPQAANLFLRRLGIDPATAALMIQQGPRMREWLAMQKRFAPSEADVAASRKLTDAQGKLGAAYDSLASKLMTALAPALEWIADKLERVIEYITKWVEAHPKWAAAITGIIALLAGTAALGAIAGAVAMTAALAGLAGVSLAPLLASLGAIAAILAGGTLAAYLGGAFDEAEAKPAGPHGSGIVGLRARARRMAGKDATGQHDEHGSGNDALRNRGSGGRLGKAQVNANSAAAMDELKKAGYNDFATAAILGSMQTESRFKPSIVNGSGHTGLWQWDGTQRWPKIKKWIENQGGNPFDARWQTKAWIAEHNAKPGDAIYDNGSTERGGRILRSNPTLGQAVTGVRLSERFGAGEEGGRARNAETWLPQVRAPAHTTAPPITATPGSPPIPEVHLWKGNPAVRDALPTPSALNSISNNYRASTSTSSNEAHIHGDININAPQATDAHGIARHIDSALSASMFANAANYGPA